MTNDTEKSDFYVLITGANGGLGLSIAKRLITEFVKTRPTQIITLIITTRSASKSSSTLTQLLSHISTLSSDARQRVRLSSFQVDLTNLSTVLTLSKNLHASIPKLDVAIFNAGMGIFTGIDWVKCYYRLLTGWINAVTHPDYKLQAVGCTAAQRCGGEIGEVFAANVFGHYFLGHEVMGLLNRSGSGSSGGVGQAAGRIIWVSSLEAYAHAFDVNDIEGIRAKISYESSKRLTDILSLTSLDPCTRPWTTAYYNPELPDRTTTNDEIPKRNRVKMLLAHPGICATAIVALPLLLWYCMTLAFFVARWFGSPWHTISTWIGAASVCKLALASEEEIVQMDAERIKIGSGTNRWGTEMLRITDVEGFGTKNRKDGGDDNEEQTKILGREVWKTVEELRKVWREKLV